MEHENRKDIFWKTLAVVLLVVLVGFIAFDFSRDQRPRVVYREGSRSQPSSEFAALSPSLTVNHESIYWVADLAEQALPFVVNVRTLIDFEESETDGKVNRGDGVLDFFMPEGFEDHFSIPQMPDSHPPMGGEGSGFIISEDGYIVTNAHVVEEPDSNIFRGSGIKVTGVTYKVRLDEGEEMDAELVGVDRMKDIAVLKIDGKGLPTAVLGNSGVTRIGEPVVAIGSPLGYEATVTAGILSTNKRSLEDLGRPMDIRKPQKYLQTDAAINQGNSGGPLLNADGEVIGVNQAITRLDRSMESVQNRVLVEGIGFAIPIDEVKNTIEQLVTEGKVSYPGIQAQITSVPEYILRNPGLELEVEEGVYVVEIILDGPADRAGIKAGDVILSINDVSVATGQALIEEINNYSVGDRVTMRVARQGGKQHSDITVVLGELDLSQFPIE